MMLIFLTLLFVAFVSPSEQFRVCGNYCGPKWCSDRAITEKDCVASGVWGMPANNTCADSCCRTHDYCCGKGADRSQCNNALVACLQSSACYTTLCGASVWLAMKTVHDWCCSGPCPTKAMEMIEAAHQSAAKLG